MNCPQCNTLLPPNQTFCHNYGTLINTQQMPNQMMASQQPYQQQYQNASKENTSSCLSKNATGT